MSSKITYIRYLLLLAAGAIFPLGFSPFDFWPVSALSIALAFLLCRTLETKSAAIGGFVYGTGLFGAGTSWIYVSIHEFGAASPPLAGFLTLLFALGMSAFFLFPPFALYACLNKKLKQPSPWRQALIFAGLWVPFEWVRSWFLTGFPWLLTGYSLLDTPFASLAAITGVYGLSLIVAVTGCLLAASIIPKGRKPALILALVSLIPWALAIPAGNIQWTEKTGNIEFSAIQGNIPQDLKWEPDFLQSTINTYTSLSSGQWEKDLVIWPENAIPVLHSRARGFLEQIDREVKSQGSTLILGMPVDDYSAEHLRYYNSVISLGQGSGQYHKQKLVPFGEYVPLQSMLRGLIDFFDLPMSDFARGSSQQELLTAADGAVIAPYICYEVVYPDFAANLARDSGLLLTVSNDTWFGESIGPLQHFQMARMRALETDRFLIRATNDGLSALIDNKGEVLETIPRFEKGVLSGTAEVRKGSTPFMILGSLPTIIFSLLMLAITLFAKRRR